MYVHMICMFVCTYDMLQYFMYVSMGWLCVCMFYMCVYVRTFCMYVLYCECTAWKYVLIVSMYVMYVCM